MDNKIKYKAGLCYLCSVDLTEIRFPLSSGPTNDTCFHLPTLLVVCVAGRIISACKVLAEELLSRAELASRCFAARMNGGFAAKALIPHAQKQ